MSEPHLFPVELLTKRADEMGILLEKTQADAFASYYHMLEDGNKVMNLTGPLEPEDAIARHFLDALAPLPHGLLPAGARVIDVGSGAGFPGIPLAIARPDLTLTLVDSLKKRVDFLKSVSTELELNASPFHARVEDAALASFTPLLREQFDVAVARAVAPLNVLAELCLPFVQKGGLFIAYKGPGAEAEMQGAKEALKALGGGNMRMLGVSIPQTDWDHRLVIIEKIDKTPAKYPRKAGLPAKNPL